MKINFAALLASLTVVTVVVALSATAQQSTTTKKAESATSTNKFKLKVIKVDSQEIAAEEGGGTNAVDGKPSTHWHTEWQDANPECPHEIIIEIIPPTNIKGFTYLPRQDGEVNGTIKDYEFFISDNEKEFGTPVKKGTFPGGEGKEKRTLDFEAKKGRYIKLKALSEINGAAWTSAAEISVIPVD